MMTSNNSSSSKEEESNSPTSIEKRKSNYHSQSNSDDFEIITPFKCCQPDSNEKIQKLENTNLKLSYLKHTKRTAINNESNNLCHYIFNLVNQKLSSDPTLIKCCIDFISNESFSNKIIIEFDSDGKVINCVSDLIGFSSLGLIHENVESIFKDFTIQRIREFITLNKYSIIEMLPGNIGEVEIFVYPTNKKEEYLILIRY